MPRSCGAFLLALTLGLVFWLSPAAHAQPATLRPLTPFASRFGNGCQTQIICAAIERLGLYAGLRLDGSVTQAGSGRELALGSTVSMGLDLIHRVAFETSFPVGVSYRGIESTLLLAGPLHVGARLRLGGEVPTLFSERPQPRWALVLGAYTSLPLPHAAGDERRDTALGVPQPSIMAAVEIAWGPAQIVPSLGLLIAEQAAYLNAGGRVSLSLSPSVRFDLEAQSRIPVQLREPQGRCGGGTRAGLGLRGVLKKGVLGSAHYELGSGECEPAHRILLDVTFAFGQEPLGHIPTPEEAGVPRAWLGMVDPVLDCNGWMLDEATLLPKFKFGDPDPRDPNLIRRGAAVFRVGEHFDIDRSGRVYRPYQYIALADDHVFTEAKTAEKLALPVCDFGPKHRFFEHCQFLAKVLDKLSEAVQALDEGHGAMAAQVRELQYEEECLSSDEKQDPRLLVMGLLGARRMRASTTAAPPPAPPIRKPPDELSNHGPPPTLGKGQSSPAYASHVGEDGVQVVAAGAGRGGSASGGSARPRNGHLAGQDHPRTQLPFDAEGYPDFRAAGVVKLEVKIKPTGNRPGDERAANRVAGFTDTPYGYTWHHHQDGTTMQLVPRDLHRKTGHTGGYARTKQ